MGILFIKHLKCMRGADKDLDLALSNLKHILVYIRCTKCHRIEKPNLQEQDLLYICINVRIDGFLTLLTHLAELFAVALKAAPAVSDTFL